MPKRRLTNIATRGQVLLERLKAHEVKNFAAVIPQLDKAIREVINAIDTPSMGDLTRKELTALLSQLKQAAIEVLGKSVEGLFKTLEPLAAQQAQFEANSINATAGKKVVSAATPKAAWAEATAQPISATGSLLQAFADQWTAGEALRLSNLVQRAWGEGWTVQQMTQAVRGTRALNYKDGLFASTTRNAEALVRTAIQHVASTARLATLQANSDVVDGYTYVATLDSKTTPECRSLDGEHFKFGAGPVPPIHINCRSTIVADIKPDIGLDFLDQGATRSAEFGPVPADQTYYEWLQDQNPDFIKEALGESRAQLFIDGGLSASEFARLNLGKDFQPLTLDEMKQLEPLAFKKAGLN